MNTSFSCSETRTPTKASASITDFSLASLCSSVKKERPQASTTNASSAMPSFAFDFKTDRDLAKANTNSLIGGTSSLYSAMGAYTGSTSSGVTGGGGSGLSGLAGLSGITSGTSATGSSYSTASTTSSSSTAMPSSTATSTSTSSSSTSYLSMDMIQNKIEYLERERIDLAMQLHKRDEKDRDRKLRLETLETRLKHAEEDKSKAYQEASEQREQVIRLTCEVNELKTEIIRLQKEIQSTNRFEAMDVWKKMTIASRELKRCEEELATSHNERAVLTTENNRLLAEHESMQQRLSNMEKDKQALQETIHQLQHSLQQHWIEIPQLKEENMMLHMQVSTLQQEYLTKIERLTAENEAFAQKALQLEEELQQQVQTLQSNSLALVKEKESDYDFIVKELRQKLMESENKRRKLHNQVQDLRGNIRVFVRCRPFLASDNLPNYQELQDAIVQAGPSSTTTAGNLLFHDDECSLSLINSSSTSNVGSTNGSKPHQFTFDHIFRSTASQEDIYKEVSDLVQSVMDGYRVCVFSYGQTGSGKTHTMTGSKIGDERGIIPRAIEELLQQTQALKENGWQININASIVELYNEELRDLLAPTNSKSSSSASVAASIAASLMDKKEKYKIMKQDGRVIVSGLSNVSLPTDDYEEGIQRFHKLLDTSSQVRTTASTGMNEMSSRSHLIVMLDVIGTITIPSTIQGIPSQTKTLHGGLRLCDLAGSERLDRTNTLHDATRLKETVNINKSLSCLADVFLALSSKASHVPYRNSKLTMLLQDCLSGDGKSLMFVNVSPTPASSQETLCSLRFANQVSQVELGKAQKHLTTVIQSVAPPVPTPVPVAAPTVAALPAPPAPQQQVAVMPPAPPAAASTGPPPVIAPVVADASAATPRPDRIKMRSSSFSAKLMQPNFDVAATNKPAETTPTRAKLTKQASVPPSSSSSSTSASTEPVAKTSDKKAVRFSTLATSVSAAVSATPSGESDATGSHRPLPMYSFLSGNQPERAVGTAPKVRNLGASRRNSTLNGPSLASAGLTTAQRIKAAESSYLIHHPAIALQKENESNTTVTVPTRGHKRESVCPDLMGAKRLRSVTAAEASAVSAAGAVPEWNSSTFTAATNGKKSSWR